MKGSIEATENKESDEFIVAELQKYLDQGYVLHGGKEKLDILTPQQATDDDPNREIGKSHAIYAENQDMRVPIFMALKDRKDPQKGFTSSYSGHGPGKPMTFGGDANFAFGKGYVYVLPSDTFEVERDSRGNEELVSKVPVTPIKIFEVGPSILDQLSGIEFEVIE